MHTHCIGTLCFVVAVSGGCSMYAVVGMCFGCVLLLCFSLLLLSVRLLTILLSFYVLLPKGVYVWLLWGHLCSIEYCEFPCLCVVLYICKSACFAVALSMCILP